ncbi:Membrane metalloprotease [Labilithrix luteola]|uniref:Membrane metalloprotease n=1 Tax=Labilithrix luteola TaxID=1391654 RepID=A0A0K1QCJ3_9BACT|nr:hypothetical protein [Labilithrix luteola]AKV03501.1 Membrane metalloprotease [Labilithrix luteola]
MRLLRFGGISLGIALASALASLSCSSSSDGSSGSSGTRAAKVDAQTLFGPNVTNVDIEVDYAAGAAPYVGTGGQYKDVWNLFRTNTNALFDGKKDISFPNTLEGMEKLDDVTAGEFTKSDVLAIAKTHRQGASTAATASFYVVFLDGKFKDDAGTVLPDVTSTAIADKGVIAIFKPAITANPNSAIAPLVEQSALLHQIGHVVGFVNNGVPLNSEHHDAANGAHCTNKACIMNVAFEGAEATVNFVAKSFTAPDPVIFGQECLSDARILENKLLPE